MLKACNVTRHTVLAESVRRADSWWDRSRGLLGTSDLPVGTGLLLMSCRAVHSCFMTYPIDVVFLDSQSIVVGIETLKPWRFSHWRTHAQSVLELPAGTCSDTKTVLGDQLSMETL